jgi:hypothetical protein
VEIRNKERKTLMQYTKPNLLATVRADAAIQDGTGASEHNGTKMSIKADFRNGPLPHTSTTGAYEADE